MKFKKIIISTFLLMGISAAQAEEVSPYYFDLISINKNTDLASNFINNKIRELGGIERVKEAQKAGDDLSSMVMGYIYMEGHVYEKNIDMAIDILSNAADTGGYSAFLLGKHYLDLDGEFNYSEDIRREGAAMVEFAALHDIAEAEYITGMLFISGEYLPEDRDIGMIHIKSASYKGHAPSRKFLSVIDKLYYQESLDFDKIQKMSTEGNVDAIIELALMYKEGWKVSRDTVKAIRLLEIAYSKGSEKALLLLDKIRATH
jgi:TPR repeat protein